MKWIRYIAFQGTGRDFVYLLNPDDNPLLVAGHVAYEFQDTPGLIIGFHPPEWVVIKEGGLETLMKKLHTRQVVKGTLQDDTDVFHRAYELSQNRPNRMEYRLMVYVIELEFEDEDYDLIHTQFMQCYNQSRVLDYRFSPIAEDAPYDNCATVVRRFEMPIIMFERHYGEMKLYIPIFVEIGDLWIPDTE